METEAIENHDRAKTHNRIHGAVFKVNIFFDAVDIAKGELTDNECPDAVAE